MRTIKVEIEISADNLLEVIDAYEELIEAAINISNSGPATVLVFDSDDLKGEHERLLP